MTETAQQGQATASELPVPQQQPTTGAEIPEDQSSQVVQEQLVRFTGLLVLVGFLQVIAMVVQATVYWFTLKAIRRQGLSMRRQTTVLRDSVAVSRKSARAAKASADALIEMERAWLVVDINGFDRPQDLLTRARQTMGTVEISIPFTNYGRTPAWVIEWSRRMVITDTSDLQGPLDYGTADASQVGTPFPPGQQERPTYFFVDWTIQDASQIREIEQGRSFLYVYGFVRYRDIFNRVRETYFCLRYFREVPSPGVDVTGWTVAGPPEGNRHT